LDKPESQLQIEVRLVERLAGDEKKVGIDFPKSFSASLIGAETTAPITKSGASQSGSATVLSAWFELPSTAEQLHLGVLSFDQLKATMDILASDNLSRLVSNPKVTTLNYKKAIIKIGTTIPIPEISRGPSGDLFSYKEKDVNMTLEVTPMIGDSGMITLELHPVLEEIVGYTGSSDALQPITSRREVQTTVLVKDGETVVIGGLVKESKSENVSKIWLLGDIPILGYLFRHTSIVNEKKDLMIFITSKIM
jgi:general secretion pathway protein D